MSELVHLSQVGEGNIVKDDFDTGSVEVGFQHELDGLRFEELMRTEAAVPVETVQSNYVISNVTSPENSSIGDTILQGIESLRSGYEAQLESIGKLVERGDGITLSSSELVQLQFQLVALSLEQEAATKITDHTSQGVQTLFRQQG